MATLIDSLIVSLNLDTKDFKKGTKEVEDGQKKLRDNSDRTSKQMDQQSKKVADSILKVRDQVIGLYAAFTAGRGIKDFVEAMTSADAALGRAARNMGVSSSQLSAWQQVAQQSGGTADGMTASMNGLAQQFQQLALTGQSAVVPYFRAIGVAIADSAGRMRPMNDILFDLSDKLSKMDPARAQALGRGLGLDTGTVNVLMQGRDALKALLAQQDALGHANEADTKAAAERQKKYEALKVSLVDLGRKILTQLTPAINSMVDTLTKFSEWGEKHPTVMAIGFGLITTAVFTLSAALIGLNAIRFFGLISSLGKVAEALGVVRVAGTAAEAAAPAAAAGGGGFLFGLASALGVAGWFAESTRQNAFDSAIPGGPNHDQYVAEAMAGGAVTPAFGGSRAPRGIRNNNPGNLNFVGQSGATKESGPGGRFAVFATMQQGLQALAHQLQLYGGRGIDTVQGIISKYAPAGENNTNSYIQSVMRKLGVSASQHLNLQDPNVLKALIQGITTVEVGAGKITDSQIDSALRVGAGTSAGNSTNNNSSSTNSHQTTIGAIHVNAPNATDASSIAKNIGPAVSQYSFAGQANYGLAG